MAHITHAARVLYDRETDLIEIQGSVGRETINAIERAIASEDHIILRDGLLGWGAYKRIIDIDTPNAIESGEWIIT